MTAPFVRDPKPYFARLTALEEDGETTDPLTLLSRALRSALAECAEEQAVATAGLGLGQAATSDAYAHGRLYVANKVVRRIGEYLDLLPTAAEINGRAAVTRTVLAEEIAAAIEEDAGYFDTPADCAYAARIARDHAEPKETH